VIGVGRWRLAWWLPAVFMSAAAPSPAGADETVYDQDGYKLVVGVHGALGGYAAGNTDFGAGDVNTKAPLEGPFAPSQRRVDRQWFEGFARPFAEVETPFFGFGHAYGLISVDGALTRGSGDPLSSLAPQGARSSTSNSPAHAELEDLAVGWHSGELLVGSLGDDAVDISVGRQSFQLGDAFLIGTGVVNGFSRAAAALTPHTSFDRTVILKLNSEPVRLQVFNLETRTDQTLMHGFDQPQTDFAGFELGFFKAGDGAPARKSAGEREATQAAQESSAAREKKEVPDLWSAGFDFFHVYSADSTPGTFSFPPGEESPTLSVNGNRDGLNVFSGYLHGSFFEVNRDILLHSQFALERNDAVNRQVRAAAWYVEPGYKFSTLPWTPQVNLRYAHFSGDPNPDDRVKQSYDPLFTTGGDRGFGSWTQGEIFGQWISPNSNLNVKMVNFKVSPLPDLLDLGAIYYSFDFDQVSQFNNPGITAHHAADELDLYAKWSPNQWFDLTGVFGFAIPGAGMKQAAAAFVAENGPAGRAVGRTMTLVELIAEIKY
jgi:Alginate export